MVKKKSERVPKTYSEAVGFKQIFKNEKAIFLMGIVLILIAIYIIIAFSSFLSTGQADQSYVLDLRQGEMENTTKMFQNHCGSFGALLSYFLIVRCFGLPAYLIPLLLILIGLKVMGVYKVNLWKWFFGTMLLMIWSSVTLAKFLTPILSNQVFNPGGDHGEFCKQYLENIIGSQV